MKYTLSEIMQMDQYLMQLASYEVTDGMRDMPKSMEDVVKLHEETHEKFCYFKNLIQSGECTIEELEQLVVMKYGAIYNPDRDLSFSEYIKKMAEEPKNPEMHPLLAQIMGQIQESLPEGSTMGEPIFIGPDGITDMSDISNFMIDPTEPEEFIEPVKKPKRRTPKKTPKTTTKTTTKRKNAKTRKDSKNKKST